MAVALERSRSHRRGQRFDDSGGREASINAPAVPSKRRSEATIRDEESLALPDLGGRGP
jgi:hypothetical protein